MGNIFIWVNGPKLEFKPSKREFTWELELTASNVPEQASKAFHLWIERYNHPTFQVHFDVPDKTNTKLFTISKFIDLYVHTLFNIMHIDSLACGKETIAVGSAHNGDIADHCCLGPKRYPPDDIYRPQLLAPGTCIQAANSNTNDGIVAMNGTSQATAFATGIIAVMLAIAHPFQLRWCDIKDLLSPYYYDHNKRETFKLLDADVLFQQVKQRGEEFQKLKKILIDENKSVPEDITYERAKQLNGIPN